MNAVFTFHRGSLALDFVGTVGRRASKREERLRDAGALDTWLRDAGLAESGVGTSAAELEDARRLREAIARTGYTLIDGGEPASEDIATINTFAAGSTLARPAFDPATLTARWVTQDPVRFALSRVAADAVDLFGTRRGRLVRCELTGCGALLLSHSRGPARRWCSMETCGNVAKVAAHRARARSRAAREQRPE